MTGRVKSRFDAFGFIRADDGTDLFFHNADVVGGIDVETGDRVVFDIVAPQPAKGPRAALVALEASR